MRVILEIVDGPQTGRKIWLQGGQAGKVGRTEWADFALPDDLQISAVHFALECGESACRLRDLGSTNGTLVNGKKVREAILNDRDKVSAGQTTFLVYVEGAAPAAGPAPAAPSAPPALGVTATLASSPLSTEHQPAPTPPPAVSVTPAAPPPPKVPVRFDDPRSEAFRVVLEIVAGPDEKRKVWLHAGEAVEVGRTELADLALSWDSYLSSLHFAVQCGDRSCRLRDLGSSNGTFLNGNRVTEAMLSDGDEIRAGQTRFIMHVEGSGPSAIRQTQRAVAGASYAALEDPDVRVRQAALLAAAWTRQPWLLEHCRKLCDHATLEHWDPILLLAILGGPDELPRIEAVGREEQLGARRFQALGAYGHPALVEALLHAIASDDPATAAAAGAAFKKVTAADIDSDRRARLPPQDGSQAGEFEQEFLDEVLLPSPEKAQAHWSKCKPRFSGSTRVCQGLDLSQAVSEEILTRLDMESRWEACLRSRFQGTWRGRLSDLERFPLFERPTARPT